MSRILSSLALRLSQLRARIFRRGTDERALQQRETLLSPDEVLIWIHAPKHAEIPAHSVAAELIGRAPELPILLTHPDGIVADTAHRDILRLEHALDTAATLRNFQRDWRPSVALIFAEAAQPDLIMQLRQSGAQVLLYAADAEDGKLGLPSANRLVLRGLLRQLTKVLTQTQALEQQFHFAGLPIANGQTVGQLPLRPPPRPVDSTASQNVAAQLAGRPSWLATEICPDEEDIILSAYETTAQKAHRNLLVVQLSDPDRAEVFRIKAKAQGRQVVRRSVTDRILAETQIVIADKPEETQLWYRIVPLTFLGQTMRGTGGVVDPFVPACLGSAILHGPHMGHMQDAYTQLDRAGAARMVRDLDHLSRVLIELQAADKVAAMAHAAWDLTTQNAEATALVVQAILSQVQERKAA